MSKLKEYLTELGENSALLEKYKADPEKTMVEYGLGKEETDAVLSADVGKVQSLTGVKETMGIVYHGKYV